MSNAAPLEALLTGLVEEYGEKPGDYGASSISLSGP